MYTRDFCEDTSQKGVPDSYCGSLFKDECSDVHNATEPPQDKESSVFHSFFKKGFDLKNFSPFKNGFGTEEILILGIAAFLFFSKGGDKECAVILLLSLFIT